MGDAHPTYFNLLANYYSWVKARFTQHSSHQGNAFRSTPRHNGTLWLKYHWDNLHWADKLSMGGGLVFVDKRQVDNANSFEVPGYIRADQFAHYQWDRIDLHFKVENLLDKR